MYNFKKNAKLYLVENGNKHALEVYSDLSASQTFDEQGYRLKNLHRLTDLHEGATITEASPANFEFTVPILDISSTPILLTLACSYESGNIPSFDTYIESDNIIYKISTCVIERATFNISMDAPITLSVSGTGSQILKYSGTIPGTLVNVGTKEYTRVLRINSSINGSSLSSVAGLNIEIANDIAWIPNNTLHSSLQGTIAYPTAYYTSKRTMSGSISQFLTSENIDILSDINTGAPIVLNIYSKTPQATPLLKFNLPSCVFTRRISLDELFLRVYDFRLNTNSTTVKPIYKGV